MEFLLKGRKAVSIDFITFYLLPSGEKGEVGRLSKGVYCYKKEFACIRGKFFPLKVYPFDRGGKIQFNRVASLESVDIHLNMSLTVRYTAFNTTVRQLWASSQGRVC